MASFKRALILAALFGFSAARLPAQALVTVAMRTSPVPDGTPQQSPSVEGPALSRSGSRSEVRGGGTGRIQPSSQLDGIVVPALRSNAGPGSQVSPSVGGVWWVAHLSFASAQQVTNPTTEKQPVTSQPTPQAPENPDHIFLVIPAYRVVYEEHVPPLTPHEKLREFLESTYDLRGLAFAGAETLLLEHSNTDGFCGYGPGLGGFAKCYGSARLDANVSGFFGDYLFPVWMHQDPRYFRLGRRASVGTRLVYALSRVFITRSETTDKPVFDSSALAGTTLAGALSNLYYPQTDRGVGLTLSRIGIDLLGTASFNLGAEFWDDIKTRLFSQN